MNMKEKIKELEDLMSLLKLELKEQKDAISKLKEEIKILTMRVNWPGY